MKKWLQILMAGGMLGVMAWGSALADSPVKPGCTGFEEGTPLDPYSGFLGVGVTLSIATSGPAGGSDPYLHTHDDIGASYVVAPPRFFNGDYSGLGTCSSICFDVILFNDGNPGGNHGTNAPHDFLTPTVTLVSGGLSATFVASPSLRITEPGGANSG